jgi:uncharacterized circularly permuted ATP-grasp superfamily protein
MSFTENTAVSYQADPLIYVRQAGLTDEVHDQYGQVHRHWQQLLDSLQQLGGDNLKERQLKAERILRDDGASYTLASDSLSSRPWGLDPVPLLRTLLVPVHFDASEDLALESALLTAEALNTYRRRYRADASIVSGLGLLLVDRSNPRSLIYQLDKLRKDLAELQPRDTSYTDFTYDPEITTVATPLSDPL